MKRDGKYICKVENCGKTFSRSDHLARHKVNHSPKRFFHCKVKGCEKVFVRKDVKEKHESRHKLRVSNKSIRQLGEENAIVEEQSDDHAKADSNIFMQTNNKTTPGFNMTVIQKDANDESAVPTPNLNLEMNPMHSPFFPNGVKFDSVPQMMYLEPYDLTQWLFYDEEFHSRSEKSSPSYSNIYDLGGMPADKLLRDILNDVPNTFSALNHTNVDDELVQGLILIIPDLRKEEFGRPQIECCLNIFWSICQVQYPILHRPSFHTSKANLLLLLCMIMIGAGLIQCTGVDDSSSFTSHAVAHRLAHTIAVPLRWLILSSDEFGSSPKVWIIQSLVLLEIYETLLSTRKLHERAYLHHGLKIQLLRRSRLLGGDPLNQSNDYKETSKGENNMWNNWVELESLKRAALVSFYLDTINAVIFGHEIILYAHQIKLLMPLDDMVWEMTNIDKNNIPPQVEPPRFINALTKLLKQEHFQIGPLGKKILLAGLVTIRIQMEQKDLGVTLLDWKPIKESWKDTIYRAIEVWKRDICRDCCDMRTSYYSSATSMDLHINSFSLLDTTCKLPVYHLTQAFTKIQQYDCIIYVGASTRMDVKITNKDYEIVNKRIKDWSTSHNGPLTVMHCYVFLNEILFQGNDTLKYDASTDPFFHRPNVVALTLFLIWAYNFSLYGAESNAYTERGIYISREEGYAYLKRITHAFGTPLSNSRFQECSKILPKIQNTHHIVGFLMVFLESFKKASSEICKEYGGLIQNCIERSMGKTYIIE